MKNRQIQAVVFDMDGTMFNTEDIYDQVSQRVLQERGHEFTRELKLKMMGLPSLQAFQVMIDHFRLTETADKLATETHEIFGEVLPSRIQMMPGLASLLDYLELQAIPKGVATSSSRRFANLSLQSCQIGDRFDFVLTSEDVDLGKPHPEIYHLAATRFGILPDRMLVLEDSPIGSRAAVDSGAITVAVPCDHTRHCDFSHVDHRVESLEDRLIYQLLAVWQDGQPQSRLT